MEEITFKARLSPKDYRNVKHEYTTASPVMSGGYVYADNEIEHQHKVGICTAISTVQNAEKVFGKKFSPDFQYLLQKKYYDGDWEEGSSIFSAMKVAKNYGFLPIELFTYVTEQDRFLPYDQYIAKLQAIPDPEIQRLISLCSDKITGYGYVDISTKESIAKAVLDSKAGILCHYTVGSEWWTPSWNEEDINPLKPPVNPVGGHAINMTYIDYTQWNKQTLTNTWGNTWCRHGNADVNYDNYKLNEAWIPYYASKPIVVDLPKHQPLSKNLYFGMTDPDVKRLQKVLGVETTGFFGFKTLAAVRAYQRANGINPAVGFVGKITRASLNSKYF